MICKRGDIVVQIQDVMEIGRNSLSIHTAH